MSIVRQGLSLLALLVLVSGCSRTGTPTPDPTASQAASEAATDAHGGPQAREPWAPEPLGTDPDFAARFQPMEIPTGLKKFVDPKIPASKRPPHSQADAQLAAAALSDLMVQGHDITSYFEQLPTHAESVRQKEVTQVVQHLVTVTLTGTELRWVAVPLATPPEYGFPAWQLTSSYLDSKGDEKTSALIREAFDTVAGRLASSAGDCREFDEFQLRMLTYAESWVALEFRAAFDVARFEAGRSSCGVFESTSLVFTEAQLARMARLVGDEAHSAPTGEMAWALRETCRSREPDSIASSKSLTRTQTAASSSGLWPSRAGAKATTTHRSSIAMPGAITASSSSARLSFHM